MMQTTDLRERDDLASTEWVFRTALWTILVERKMRSRFVVILKIGRQHAAQVALTGDDDVIEALAAHRANDALDISVLPRRARCRNDLLDSHHLDAIAERLMTRRGPAADIAVLCPRETPRSFDARAKLASDCG